MKLGTIVYDNKIYNLDYMNSEEIGEILRLIKKAGSDSQRCKNTIRNVELNAIFYRVYIEKISMEIINTKVNNQINSVKISINQINHKFTEKSKNYDKVNEHIVCAMEKYEKNLKIVCNMYDEKIEQYILKRFELENKLFGKNTNPNIAEKKRKPFLEKKNKNIDVKEENEECIRNKIKEEIKKVNNTIAKLNEEKISKLYGAMEMGGNEVSTQIRRPRKIKSIAKFFSNKFNTYKTIERNVIIPLNMRIDEFKNKNLDMKYSNKEEFELVEFEKKLPMRL